MLFYSLYSEQCVVSNLDLVVQLKNCIMMQHISYVFLTCHCSTCQNKYSKSSMVGFIYVIWNVM